MTAPKHPGGRPRAPERSVAVSTWISASEYDRLLKLAQKHEVSVARLVRDLLKLRLPEPQ